MIRWMRVYMHVDVQEKELLENKNGVAAVSTGFLTTLIPLLEALNKGVEMPDDAAQVHIREVVMPFFQSAAFRFFVTPYHCVAFHA